jgi:hypothetical protein
MTTLNTLLTGESEAPKGEAPASTAAPAVDVNIETKINDSALEAAIKAAEETKSLVDTQNQELLLLKQQNKELLEKAAKVDALQETVEGLLQKFAPPEKEEKVTKPDETLTQTAVEAMLQKALADQRSKDEALTNMRLVSKSLAERFGGGANEYLETKAKEVNLSVEAISELSARSPEAALAILGISQSGQHDQRNLLTQGTINTSGLKPTETSNISRNTKPFSLGYTSQDVADAGNRAKAMVEELHKKGLTTNDLTDPKVYAKLFK